MFFISLFCATYEYNYLFCSFYVKIDVIINFGWEIAIAVLLKFLVLKITAFYIWWMEYSLLTFIMFEIAAKLDL